MLVCQDFMPSLVLTRKKDGTATGVARIAREGVYTYHINEIEPLIQEKGFAVPQKTLIKVLRTPEATRDNVSMWEGEPVVAYHDHVSITNKEETVKGWTGKTAYVNGWQEAETRLVNEELIQAIVAGQASDRPWEFSNLHKASLAEGSGTWTDINGVQGEPGKSYDYDFVMTVEEPIHVSAIPFGTARAGRGAKYVADSIELNEVNARILEFNDQQTFEGNKTMPKTLKEYMDGMQKQAKDMGVKTVSVDMGEHGLYEMPESLPDNKTADSIDLKNYVPATTFAESSQQLQDARATIQTQETTISGLKGQLMQAQSPKYQQEIYDSRVKAWREVGGYIPNLQFEPTNTVEDWYRTGIQTLGNSSKDSVRNLEGSALTASWETVKRMLGEPQNVLLDNGVQPYTPTGQVNIAAIRGVADSLPGRSQVQPQKPSYLQAF